MAQHLTNGLRDKSASPIRYAYPVTYLALCVGYADIADLAKHQPNTAGRMPRLLQHHSVSLRRGQHAADNLTAVLHARMDRPTGNRANCGIAGVSV